MQQLDVGKQQFPEKRALGGEGCSSGCDTAPGAPWGRHSTVSRKQIVGIPFGEHFALVIQQL